MGKSKIEDTETEAVRVKTPSNWHITKRVYCWIDFIS